MIMIFMHDMISEFCMVFSEKAKAIGVAAILLPKQDCASSEILLFKNG